MWRVSCLEPKVLKKWKGVGSADKKVDLTREVKDEFSVKLLSLEIKFLETGTRRIELRSSYQKDVIDLEI